MEKEKNIGNNEQGDYISLQPVGRLYVYHGEAADRILKIGLLKQYRGLGIGKKMQVKYNLM